MQFDDEQNKATFENENPELENNNHKKSIIKYTLNITLVLLITAIAIFLTVKDDFTEIVDNLMRCDVTNLLIAFGILISAILVRTFIVFLFARLYTRKYNYIQALASDFINCFYSAVTPGESGGQVMQAYTLKKQGIPISSAVSMLAMYSILFQVVLICYGIVSFIVKYDTIMAIEGITLNIGFGDFTIPIWPLTIMGFLLNIGFIGIILLMGYWRGFHNFIMGPIITLLGKMHILKNPDKSRESLRIQVENFKIEMRRLYSNVPFTILICFLFFIYISVKYSVPYFVGLALGNESTCSSFFDAIFLSNYHQMMTGLIPIPGAAGVSELFFIKLFVSESEATSFFWVGGNFEESAKMAKAALLLWRSITFIIPLIAAGFVTAFYRASPHEEVESRNKIPNRETFISLQDETYVERKMEMATMLETSRLTREAVLERLKSLNPKTKIANRNEKNKKKNTVNKKYKETTKINIGDDD